MRLSALPLTRGGREGLERRSLSADVQSKSLDRGREEDAWTQEEKEEKTEAGLNVCRMKGPKEQRRKDWTLRSPRLSIYA